MSKKTFVTYLKEYTISRISRYPVFGMQICKLY